MKLRKLRLAKWKSSGVPLADTADVQAVTKAFGHTVKSFVAIAVTDGSGSQIGNPTGSAARLLITKSMEESLLVSRASSGTSQTAELDAILLVCRHIHQLKLHKNPRGGKVLFITDSSLVEKTLKAVARDPVALYNSSAHPDAAAALLAYRRRGFDFSVIRIKRNTTPVHAGVDAASRASRLLQDPEQAYENAMGKQLKKAKGKKLDGKEEE